MFTFVPAIAVWKTDVFERLRDGARSASSNVRTVHVKSALVAIEIALTVVLLVAAGLMVKSFWSMTAYPAGFDPDRILTMRIQFSGPVMANCRTGGLHRRAATSRGWRPWGQSRGCWIERRFEYAAVHRGCA